MSRILVIDNYDSFVYTIVGYLQQLGAETVVLRNDATGDVPEDLAGYDGVLVSPGPGTPHEAGTSMEIIRRCASNGVPMLGVCLGHQALAEVYGGVVTHAAELMHGKTSRVEHDGAGVLAGLDSPFTATRYHSLAVVTESVPAELSVTAWTGAGTTPIVMGVQHRELPLYGVQFHPESVLTEGGHRLLANWLAITGDADAVDRSRGLAPLAPVSPR
ncbi:glutamine amidotransferase of anthranilate synthase [Beutenbergia cavernae DSM 12333]|uniref:Glutamine amidotransferase of anthranilate synthase n=1 Tax=Beutenbergia cavernae (strain ATCC BAA-8 / DSM 12333 / CCUG 43141 / JCM 11478 / NBRC 16432 / NCIMB 13614 / HKI 0122) TaxID=471853 RepID=C5BUR7_BEUC1|nr:aminodeoxychorismate/anthranilate synthase component II [Beutenbergia cavernae]ACQ78291.1 glutamine amidotransferase of anthranilate synthase [Beutenbergia cavernae DSM 12333]